MVAIRVLGLHKTQTSNFEGKQPVLYHSAAQNKYINVQFAP